MQLPTRIGDRLPDEPSRFTLTAQIALPPHLRGEPVDLLVPHMAAPTLASVDGESVPHVDRWVSTGYREPGPKRWAIPARLTADGELEIALEMRHTFSQSAWLDSTPRLVLAGDSVPAVSRTHWTNRVFAAVAAIALLQIGLLYLAAFLGDRRRMSYLWFALQGLAASWYPLYVLGVTQHWLGHWDLLILLTLIACAPVVSVWFTHAQYRLPPPARGWLVLLGIGVLTPVVFSDPFIATEVGGKTTIATVVLTILYQLWLFAKLARDPANQPGATLLLLAWVTLGVGASFDALVWTSISDPLGGPRPALPALALFALLQAMHLSREHIRSLKRSDELNVELAGRVETLEANKQEIELLNRELRRQIADRSEQLMQALALASRRRGDAPTLSPGDVVQERYRVLELRGSGGMGAVYAVERLADGRHLALKVTREVEFIALARLAREAQIAAQLDHPNVVAIVDVDVASDGFLYLVLELVDGTTLAEHRTRFGDIPFGLEVLEQVARGLAALHEADIIHRDLKPANVLLSRSDGRLQVKITDFGISRLTVPGEAPEPSPAADAPDEPKATVDLRPGGSPAALVPSPDGTDTHLLPHLMTPSSSSLTQTGFIAGTPTYLAPELAEGIEQLSPAADIFSLGIVAYELLTTKRPYEEAPVHAVLRGAPVEEFDSLAPLDGELGTELRELLERSLALRSSERPTAAELADAIARVRGD